MQNMDQSVTETLSNLINMSTEETTAIDASGMLGQATNEERGEVTKDQGKNSHPQPLTDTGNTTEGNKPSRKPTTQTARTKDLWQTKVPRRQGTKSGAGLTMHHLATWNPALGGEVQLSPSKCEAQACGVNVHGLKRQAVKQIHKD
ncbi:hypothetical protein BKA82DRAFT_10379 [Pisolithus tinctorius]|uniref:Uncharacterized protein n=1 Tax=Pisolithus tinctorius Marx 270 TaxID=870435 RepID=A0A0C3NEK6_PISTI|nr:hypothetical protein BKA82DRAFT_10379 [Pisolithus tinctorius]KIN99534.1 hypothetical protein M404DRAFT_10379 [Pisolithus tinctorius Marx 270]